MQNLSLDPAKDDVEDFTRNVRKIVPQLGYPEAAQVMAIKDTLPLEMYNTCLNIDGFNALKEFLIKVFVNPKVKKVIWSRYI